MEIVSVTIGVPVRDLAAAVEWYRRVLELPAPDLEPVEGIAEFRLGGAWLQLAQTSSGPVGGPVGGPAGGPVGGPTVTRLGLADVRAHWERLRAAGVAVGPLEHVPGVIDYFDFADPDGNRLSLYTELPS